jgi:mannose-6-phosphate isomerase-like protein (cupin superfamily)
VNWKAVTESVKGESMVIQRKNMKTETKECLRDGKGKVSMVHLAPAEVRRHTKLFAELSLEGGASIGYHDHPNDIEYFVILHGTGIVNDNGVETPVKKGDVVVTGNGSFHSITNNGQGTLDMIALILDL